MEQENKIYKFNIEIKQNMIEALLFQVTALQFLIIANQYLEMSNHDTASLVMSSFLYAMSGLYFGMAIYRFFTLGKEKN